MNRKINFSIIVILIFSLWQTNLQGQTLEENERIIYFMRAKQFYGSGAKMNLMINGKLFHKIKSGNRLIVKTNSNDTLNIQIIYPLLKKHESRILQILPNNDEKKYIDLFYWGKGYNPLKHAGLLNPHGGTPEFNIEIVELTKDYGEQKFNQSEEFKDNNKITEKIFP